MVSIETPLLSCPEVWVLEPFFKIRSRSLRPLVVGCHLFTPKTNDTDDDDDDDDDDGNRNNDGDNQNVVGKPPPHLSSLVYTGHWNRIDLQSTIRGLKGRVQGDDF